MIIIIVLLRCIAVILAGLFGIKLAELLDAKKERKEQKRKMEEDEI